MWMKLMGIITTVVIINQSTGIGAEQLEYVSNLVKTVLVQSETDSLAYIVQTNKVMANDGVLPYLSDDEWADFIRHQMKSKTRDRDTSKDLWGMPYEVAEMDPVPGTMSIGFVVRSRGPDGRFETDDDIISGYKYNSM